MEDRYVKGILEFFKAYSSKENTIKLKDIYFIDDKEKVVFSKANNNQKSNSRTITKTIAKARQIGCPILALSRGGYYLSNNKKEIQNYLMELQDRIDSLIETKEALKLNLNK